MTPRPPAGQVVDLEAQLVGQFGQPVLPGRAARISSSPDSPPADTSAAARRSGWRPNIATSPPRRARRRPSGRSGSRRTVSTSCSKPGVSRSRGRGSGTGSSARIRPGLEESTRMGLDQSSNSFLDVFRDDQDRLDPRLLALPGAGSSSPRAGSPRWARRQDRTVRPSAARKARRPARGRSRRAALAAGQFRGVGGFEAIRPSVTCAASRAPRILGRLAALWRVPVLLGVDHGSRGGSGGPSPAQADAVQQISPSRPRSGPKGII